MVQIANPIYDTVFKYLMQDLKSAKLLLSAIIGREITALEFQPTERHLPLGEQLLVMRMDFRARVRDEQGKEELIIMELQKAKLPSDIMRFRKYLGEQYSDKENVVREPKEPYQKALPILSIYFLGHKLERVTAPVLWVNRVYIDVATGEQIHEKEDFVEGLTHDSIVVQIPYLKGKRRTELERLLALFDQSNLARDRHFLNVDEAELPKRYRPLLRRLQQALADPSVRQTMEDEDDLIEDFKFLQRQIDAKEKTLQAKEEALHAQEEALHAQEETLHAQEETLHAQEEALRAQEEALRTNKETLRAKEQLIQSQRQQIINAIRQLHTSGAPVPQIAELLGLSIAEVEEVLGS